MGDARAVTDLTSLAKRLISFKAKGFKPWYFRLRCTPLRFAIKKPGDPCGSPPQTTVIDYGKLTENPFCTLLDITLFEIVRIRCLEPGMTLANISTGQGKGVSM